MTNVTVYCCVWKETIGFAISSLYKRNKFDWILSVFLLRHNLIRLVIFFAVSYSFPSSLRRHKVQ